METTETVIIICLCVIVAIVSMVLSFRKSGYAEKYWKSPVPLILLLLFLIWMGYHLISRYTIQVFGSVTGIVYLILVVYFISRVYKYFRFKKIHK